MSICENRDTMPAYDVEAVRRDFPSLAQKVRGKPLCFLDNGASAQKPHQVIKAMENLYETCYANVHRGTYYFSEQSTQLYENARQKVCAYLNAADPKEIIFTKNATEAINLVAYSFGRTFLQSGDHVVLSEMEHHSNIVPWQILRDEIGIELDIVPVSDAGVLSLDRLQELLCKRTKLFSIIHMSNVLGTINPVAKIVEMAHGVGARVLFDGAQAVTHMPVDVQTLDCDFYVFTGHKLYGPSGIGVLYGRKSLLEEMPPFLGGGEMIASVSFENSTWADLPAKFEAGTPPIAEAVGLGAAIDYVNAIGLSSITCHEDALLRYASEALPEIKGLGILGTAPHKAAVISMMIEGLHHHDIATIADQEGVCLRAGHHCAEPLMRRMGMTGTIRASLGLYNTYEEIDILVKALEKAIKFLR